jgi:hypothetical protein
MIVSAHFCCGGFVFIEFVPDGQKYNSPLFTETVLPGIRRKLAECHPKLRAIAVHLRIDNARLHMSKISIEKIEELEFILVPHSRIHPTSHHVTFSCSVT